MLYMHVQWLHLIQVEDKLEPVDADTFYIYEVKKDCELRTFVTEENPGSEGFKRGRAYYEFTCETEDIAKDKTVILREKVIACVIQF